MDNNLKTKHAEADKAPPSEEGALLKQALALLQAVGPAEKAKEPERLQEVGAPPKGDKHAITLDAEQFSKLDEQGAALLKDHKVQKISILPKGDHEFVVAQLEKPLAFALDPASGCRKISIDAKVAADFKQGKDGGFSLKNIRGISADVDPGKDPYLGVPLPWVTAQLDSISVTKGEDGKYSVEVAGAWNGVKRTTRVPLADEQIEQVRGVLANLDKLQRVDDSKLVPKETEQQLAEGLAQPVRIRTARSMYCWCRQEQ
jgi:hypothetical protein